MDNSWIGEPNETVLLEFVLAHTTSVTGVFFLGGFVFFWAMIVISSGFAFVSFSPFTGVIVSISNILSNLRLITSNCSLLCGLDSFLLLKSGLLGLLS